MVEQLEAVFDRLARAQEHIETIKGNLLAYYDSHPCEITGEFYPEDEGPGTLDWEMRLAPLDPRLNTIVGEFLHDLRSALDHLAWQLVEADGGGANEHTYFPICKAAPMPNKEGERRPPHVAGGVAAAASALIDEAQPYQWQDFRDHPLWLLHKLWNIDKHRHIVAAGSRTNTSIVGRPPSFRFTGRQSGRTEYGATIRLVSDDPDMDVNAQTTIEIGIHEPDDGIELPLLPTLERMIEAVTRVVTDAEDCCF